jgi:hypothetical protein
VKVSGPIEQQKWSEHLEAHVVDDRGPLRVHGYDVESDLARHYRFSDVVYLTLTGELPDDARSRAFEIALCFLLPRWARAAQASSGGDAIALGRAAAAHEPP